MPIVNLVDKHGKDYLALRTKEGRTGFVTMNEDTLDNFQNFRVRDDDVFLVSPVKAGCHWTWEILKLLLHGDKSLDDPIFKRKQNFMIELHSLEHFEELPSPRILNHHMRFEDMPNQLSHSKAKVVYVYRNLKDISVSYYHMIMNLTETMKYNAPFSQFLERVETGLTELSTNLFDFMKEWDSGLDQLGDRAIVLCYEDMQTNVMAELRRLATFLGLNASEERLRRVVEITSFDAMKQRVGAYNLVSDTRGIGSGSVLSISQRDDPNSQSHSTARSDNAPTTLDASNNFQSSLGNSNNAAPSFGDSTDAPPSLGDSSSATFSLSDSNSTSSSLGNSNSASPILGDSNNVPSSLGDSKNVSSRLGDSNSASFPPHISPMEPPHTPTSSTNASKSRVFMFRKGKVGDWKNHFTVAESEHFDLLIQDRLGDLKYHQFKYQL